MDTLIFLAVVGIALISKMQGRSFLDVAGDTGDVIEQAVGAWKYDPRGNQYDAAFTAAEQKYSLPEGMMRRMAWQESRFNASATSPVGAQGLMQFMPSTASSMGFSALDPFASIDAAGRYMASLYAATGNWRDALAAYNWGIGNIKSKGYLQAPAETQQYASSIMADLNLA